MSTPHLLLIHCSNMSRTQKGSKPHGGSFRPRVIDRFDRSATDIGECSGMLAFRLVELGLLISDRSYAVLLQASLAFIAGTASVSRRIDPEETS